MTTYKITIKDNSIPEHMQKAIPNFHNEYTAIIECNVKEHSLIYNYIQIITEIRDYILEMATELDTDPESLEILSIIKQ
jgi:hypothetical protein